MSKKEKIYMIELIIHTLGILMVIGFSVSMTVQYLSGESLNMWMAFLVLMLHVGVMNTNVKKPEGLKALEDLPIPNIQEKRNKHNLEKQRMLNLWKSLERDWNTKHDKMMSEAVQVLSSLRNSMAAHPDCEEGSEFGDFVNAADDYLAKYSDYKAGRGEFKKNNKTE